MGLEVLSVRRWITWYVFSIYAVSFLYHKFIEGYRNMGSALLVLYLVHLINEGSLLTISRVIELKQVCNLVIEGNWFSQLWNCGSNSSSLLFIPLSWSDLQRRTEEYCNFNGNQYMVWSVVLGFWFQDKEMAETFYVNIYLQDLTTSQPISYIGMEETPTLSLFFFSSGKEGRKRK